MIDVNKYLDLKYRGLAEIIIEWGRLIVVGTQGTLINVSLDLNELREKKAELEAEIKKIDVVISEAEIQLIFFSTIT